MSRAGVGGGGAMQAPRIPRTSPRFHKYDKSDLPHPRLAHTDQWMGLQHTSHYSQHCISIVTAGKGEGWGRSKQAPRKKVKSKPTHFVEEAGKKIVTAT